MGNTFVNYHKNHSNNEDQEQIMTSIIDKFLTFLKTSPSPFHAVDNVLKELTAVGYERLRENDPDGPLREVASIFSPGMVRP